MEDKVKVRIKPLMGIGGVGNAGDEVWMSREEAEMYVRDGFVELVDGGQLTVDGVKSEEGPSHAPKAPEEPEVQIFPPEVKRGKGSRGTRSPRGK